MAGGRSHEVFAVAILFAALSWITVSLRIFVRARLLKAFGWDDKSMLLTQVLFSAYLFCQVGGVMYGTGERLVDLEPWRAQRAFFFWFFCEVFYSLSTAALKVAIGLFLLRVATKPLHVWIIRLVMVASAIFGLAFAFFLLFQCSPIHAFWSLEPHEGSCTNVKVLNTLTYTISALNIIADWTFAILPIFIVKDLSISSRQKGLVAGILAFAAVGSTATIVRLPYVGSLSESYLGRDGDFLYDTVGVAIWTTVEVGVGITAGCIATLRPLLQLALARFGIGSSHSGTPGARLQPFQDSKRQHAHAPGLSLDGLAPGHGIVTHISRNRDHETSFWHSRSSSQEQLAGPDIDRITKHVVVQYDEDDPPALPSAGRIADIEKRRLRR